MPGIYEGAETVLCNSTESPPFDFSDYTQRVIVASLYLTTSIVGMIGNALVILAVLLSKKLRTSTNAFVVNLSIADLLTCVVIPWDAVALLGKEGLPVGEWVCMVVGVVIFTTVGCSIYTLASISLNRLLLITRPATTYQMVFTPKKIAVWLVLAWLIPLLFTVIPPLVNVGAVGYNGRYHFCGSVVSHPSYNTYNIILAAGLYPTPLIIIVCYILIWRHLYAHSKRISSPEACVKYTASSSSSVPNSILPSFGQGDGSANIRSSQLSRRQNMITKNMFYIVCVFIICLTPFAICPLFPECDPAVPYAASLLFMNSCINPLIYATKHCDFKTVFSCILRRQWDQIPQPSDFLKGVRERK